MIQICSMSMLVFRMGLKHIFCENPYRMIHCSSGLEYPYPVKQRLWPGHQLQHLQCRVFVDGRQRRELTPQISCDVKLFLEHMSYYLNSIT